jgi:type I restriction enzyme S subunit
MAEFPNTWRHATIEDSMDAIIDYRGKSPTKSSFGIPLVTAKIVKGGRILDDNLEYIPPEDYDAWMRRGIPQAGDVVMTTEAPLGEVAQLDGRKIALAQRLITLRGNPELLDCNFLKFAMQSRFVQDQLRSRATGTTVLGIRQSELRKVMLSLPPLAEQQAIAEILGSLDDKIELNRRMNRTLEQTAAAIFKAWFVDFEPVKAKAAGATRFPTMPQPLFDALPIDFTDSPHGRIPVRWTLVPLRDLVSLQRGKTYKSKLKTLPGPVLLGLASIRRNGGFRDDKLTTYGGESPNSLILVPGDIYVSLKDVTQSADLLGAAARVPPYIKKGRLTQDTVKLIPNTPGVSQHILYHTLLTDAYRSYCRSHATGTTNLGLSREDFLAYSVVLPDEITQRYFDEIFDCLDHSLANLTAQSRTLAAIRNALLPKLLSGEVRVVAAEKLIGEVA